MLVSHPLFLHLVSLIDWISDTLSQGCTDLQRLVKCLDHRGIVLALDTIYKYHMQSNKGCVRLRNALRCIGLHLGGYHYSRVDMM